MFNARRIKTTLWSLGARIPRFLIAYWLSCLYVLFAGLCVGLLVHVLVSRAAGLPLLNANAVLVIQICVGLIFLSWLLYVRWAAGMSLLDGVKPGDLLRLDSHTYLLLALGSLAGAILLSFEMLPGSGWVVLACAVGLTLGMKVWHIGKLRLSKETLQKIKDERKRDQIIEKVSDLPADAWIEERIFKDATLRPRKYMANDIIKNALNLRGSGTGRINVEPESGRESFRFSVGWNTQGKPRPGHVNLFLSQEGMERNVFDKDSQLLKIGWDECVVPITRGVSFELRWETNIPHDLFLAIEPQTSVTSQDRKNIIVILLDGVIPESIGLYRNDSDADSISRFFSTGRLFSRAYAQGEWTLPCAASIATSLYASHHGVHDPDRHACALPEGRKTLAEILQEHRFNTFGYVGAHRASPGYGHARGFSEFRYQPVERWELNKHLDFTLSAIRCLKNNREFSNFLYLHYMDTHWPYVTSPEELSGPEVSSFNGTYAKRFSDREGYLPYLQHLYRQKMREVDAYLSLLFDYIEKYEDKETTVMLTADHATTLFDLKNSRLPLRDLPKDRNISDTMVRVPLLTRKAGGSQTPFEQIEVPVEASLSIMPTVLDVAGVTCPRDIDGRTLSEAPEGSCAVSESIYEECYEVMIQTDLFSYFQAAERDRDSGEIRRLQGAEEIQTMSGNVLDSDKDIKDARERVSSILSDKQLPPVCHMEADNREGASGVASPGGLRTVA